MQNSNPYRRADQPPHLLSAQPNRSATDSPNLEEALFQAEMAQSEREWLHHQIRSLRQALEKQARALQAADHQLELMNRELQEMLQTPQPSLTQAREVAEMLLAQKRSAIEVATKLLSFTYGATVVLEEPEQVDPSRSDQFFLGGGKIVWKRNLWLYGFVLAP